MLLGVRYRLEYKLEADNKSPVARGSRPRVEEVKGLNAEEKRRGASTVRKGEREGKREKAAIFHGFRVRANFNNIRSIRYGRPHIKSVRGERGAAGTAGCDERAEWRCGREERKEERRGSYRRFAGGARPEATRG